MASLNRINYLNVVAYVLNVGVVFGIDYTGLPSNQELSAEYQTLVTPVGWVFSIWGVIFLSQAVFTVVQLLPAYRDSPLVQSGVAYNYIGACVAQAAWSIIFAKEWFVFSMVMMLMILYNLLQIVFRQHRIRVEQEDRSDSKRSDFWLLIFPFSVHAGWITVASLVNFSLELVRFKVAGGYQLLAALVSLLLLVIAAANYLGSPHEANYVIPLVFSWATFGVYVELNNPKRIITNTFTQPQVFFVKHVAIAIAVVISSAVLARLVLISLMKSEARLRRAEETPLVDV